MVLVIVTKRSLPVKPLACVPHTAALHMQACAGTLNFACASYLKLLLAKACRFSLVVSVLALSVAQPGVTFVLKTARSKKMTQLLLVQGHSLV